MAARTIAAPSDVGYPLSGVAEPEVFGDPPDLRWISSGSPFQLVAGAGGRVDVRFGMVTCVTWANSGGNLYPQQTHLLPTVNGANYMLGDPRDPTGASVAYLTVLATSGIWVRLTYAYQEASGVVPVDSQSTSFTGTELWVPEQPVIVADAGNQDFDDVPSTGDKDVYFYLGKVVVSGGTTTTQQYRKSDIDASTLIWPWH